MNVYKCTVPVDIDTGYSEGVVNVSAYVVAHGPLTARTAFRIYAYDEYGDDILGDVVEREVIPFSDLPESLHLPNGLILPEWFMEALWQDAMAQKSDQ